jgi:hypothetical protein
MKANSPEKEVQAWSAIDLQMHRAGIGFGPTPARICIQLANGSGDGPPASAV